MKTRSQTSAERKNKLEKNQIQKRLDNEIVKHKREIKNCIHSEEHKKRTLSKKLNRFTWDQVQYINLEEYHEKLTRKEENRIEHRRIISQRNKMTEHIKTVESLSFEGNVSENWRKFKRNWDIYAVAIGLDEKTQLVKVNTFLNAAGTEAIEVFDTFNLTVVQRNTYNDVLASFEAFCAPRKNTVYERYKFHQRNQREGETFDTFLIDIKRLVRTCEFGENENEMLRDRIVIGVADKKLQSRLLETTALTYDTAVEKCRTTEATKEQTTNLNQIVTVNEVRYTQKQPNYAQHQQKFKGKREIQPHRQSSNNNNTYMNRSPLNSETQENYNRNNCTYCGYKHRPRECPAYGKSCNTCNRKNHFSSVCKSRNISTLNIVNDNDDNNDSLSFENQEFYIGSIERFVNTAETDNGTGLIWMERIRVVREIIVFKIDTGAQMNVLPLYIVLRIDPNIVLQRANVTLKAFGGQTIIPIGMCSLLCSFGNVSLRVLFAVVDFNVMPILGLAASRSFGIVDLSRSVNNNNSIGRNEF